MWPTLPRPPPCSLPRRGSKTPSRSSTRPILTVIAFVRPVGGQSHVFTYDLSTQVLTDLSAQGDSGNPGNDSKPDFAPAGAGGRIVFESDRACGYSQLYTMTLQGTDQTSVLPSTSHPTPTGTESCAPGGDDPVYSPQGDQLVFDRGGFFSQGHANGYERGWHPGSTGLSFVTIDPSGAAVGDVTGIKGYGATALEPSWGPSATPPAQTPEASLAHRPSRPGCRSGRSDASLPAPTRRGTSSLRHSRIDDAPVTGSPARAEDHRVGH